MTAAESTAAEPDPAPAAEGSTAAPDTASDSTAVAP